MWIAPVIYFVVTVILWQLGNGLFMPELLANRMFEIFPVPVIEFAGISNLYGRPKWGRPSNVYFLHGDFRIL